MLKISKLTDYAALVMNFLATHPAQITSATQLAKETHLRAPTVSKVLKILCEAGLVNSYRGMDGGYKLSKPAEMISVAEIVTAIEGSLAMTECCDDTSLCTLDSLCGLKGNWQMINTIILKVLSDLTLADMTKPIPEGKTSFRGIPIKVEGNA